MNHIYRVPVIPQNLNKQETIIQVAEVLNHLNNVTNDIFKHINDRIESSRLKLNNISTRVDEVNKKIVKLNGAKNATQVFSSCKYPAADVNRQYVSIFHDVEPPELIRHNVKYKKNINTDEQLDKLFVYHVKVKNVDNKGAASGLGEIPDDVECVNDLLLYNSGKNLYKKFEMSDALDNSQGHKEQEILNSSNIGAAPHSISERSTLTRSVTQNYFYTPNLGEVPALDVPLDLPDLPNIADDLRYDIEVDPGIAPSVITTPNIPDLPPIDLDGKDPVEEIIDIDLLPPLPPVIVTPVEEKTKEEKIEVIEETIMKEPVKETNEIAELPQLDMRASLMEAIRNAGGAKNLKSAIDSTKSDISDKKVATGGDLMADLHAKLQMRRKGISGTKKQDNAMDASSALEKISAMIPPPVPTENHETEDEDWDD